MEVNFTLQQINEVARQLAALAPAHKVFALHGEMGAGKTTLIHAWCQALGVAENVASPTFSIINQYKDGGGQTIYHMDLYRLKDEEEAIATGVEDCLFSGSICLVEWPEKAPAIFPVNTLHLYITPIDGHTRKLVVKGIVLFEP